MTTPTDIRQQAAQLTPSPRQLAWQALETIAFVHFGMNTFTNREWGEGNEDPRLFNPSALDARQWARACRDAGLKMLILTAKHHDGFCLWPSYYTEHSVKNSPWREGKGDVVREAADACREFGIRFGIYLSPWDRHEPSYGDSPAYNRHYLNQLRELLTAYGPIAEVWFDGACGEGPNGKKQVYDWPAYYRLIRELQPEAMIAVCGPDSRWVGNEEGVAPETEWSVVGVNYNEAPADYNEAFYCLADNAQPGSTESLAKARRLVWWPAETDVSIRPGWFYHTEEDLRVKSLEHLVDIYYKSVGRNTVLLLNVPPDRRGLFHEHDVRRLCELRQVIDASFAANLALGKSATASSRRGDDGRFAADKAVDGRPDTYWAAADTDPAPSMDIDLGRPLAFNRLMLQEVIAEGQRIESYTLEAWHDGAWKPVVKGTTVGYKKLERFSEIVAARVRLVIASSRAAPTLRSLGLFRATMGG